MSEEAAEKLALREQRRGDDANEMGSQMQPAPLEGSVDEEGQLM